VLNPARRCPENESTDGESREKRRIGAQKVLNGVQQIPSQFTWLFADLDKIRFKNCAHYDFQRLWVLWKSAQRSQYYCCGRQ